MSGASASCSPAGAVFLHCASPWHLYLSVTPHAHARHYHRCSARCSHPEAPFIWSSRILDEVPVEAELFSSLFCFVFVLRRSSLNFFLRAHCQNLCVHQVRKLRTTCLVAAGRPLENGASFRGRQSDKQRPTGRTSQAGALPAAATSRRSAGALP